MDCVESYAAEVSRTFRAEFDSAVDRFKDSRKLIERFTSNISAVLSNGRSTFAPVDAAHNELCIASQLLANTNPRFTRLQYEPVIRGSPKSIDFRAITDDGCTFFVDVKTIKPEARERWEQYDRAVRGGWFPKNVRVTRSENWLGGELWHSMFAARTRMLEYTVELEVKIRDCKLEDDRTVFILALCGEGFHWRKRGLEDFVSFYRTGSHRAHDPFSKMETQYIAENKIALARTITRFACMNRGQREIRHGRLDWDVHPSTFEPS